VCGGGGGEWVSECVCAIACGSMANQLNNSTCCRSRFVVHFVSAERNENGNVPHVYVNERNVRNDAVNTPAHALLVTGVLSAEWGRNAAELPLM